MFTAPKAGAAHRVSNSHASYMAATTPPAIAY